MIWPPYRELQQRVVVPCRPCLARSLFYGFLALLTWTGALIAVCRYHSSVRNTECCKVYSQPRKRAIGCGAQGEGRVYDWHTCSAVKILTTSARTQPLRGVHTQLDATLFNHITSRNSLRGLFGAASRAESSLGICLEVQSLGLPQKSSHGPVPHRFNRQL